MGWARRHTDNTEIVVSTEADSYTEAVSETEARTDTATETGRDTDGADAAVGTMKPRRLRLPRLHRNAFASDSADAAGG